MADLDLHASADVGVADKTATDTGQPQGEKPGLPAWTAQLPKPVLEKLTAERVPYKNLGELWTKFESLEQEVGKGIRVPGKDATKEQWSAYRKAAGIPESPEGYSLQRPQLPNGLPYNDRLEKWFRQQLFEAGVPDGSAQKMFNDWNAMQTATFQANQRLAQEQAVKFAAQCEETLRAEWKDDYPKNLQTVKSALARFGGTDVLSVLQQARLPNGVTVDNHPAFAKMLLEIGRRMDSDTMVGSDGAARKSTGREFVNPVTGKKIEGFYPEMERDTRFRIKAE